jgi:hypothetical protein
MSRPTTAEAVELGFQYGGATMSRRSILEVVDCVSVERSELDFLKGGERCLGLRSWRSGGGGDRVCCVSLGWRV